MRPTPTIAIAIAALAGCARAPVSVSPPPRIEVESGPRPRALTVPDRGALEVVLPHDWTVKVEEARPGEDAPPLSYRIEPGDGRFLAFVAPEPWSADHAVAATAARARGLAQAALRVVAEGSVEQELALHELKGDGGAVGYWFAATDRELAGRMPSREEWRGLLSGAAAIGDLLVTFTLFDDLPGSHRRLFLDALAEARHLAPEPAELEVSFGRAAPASELSVAYPGRAWSIVLEVPGFLVTGPVVAPDGRSVAAHAREPSSGVVASVVLRDADSAGSAAECRDRDWARILGAVGGVAEASVSQAGDAALATYVTVAATRGDRQAPLWHSQAWYRHDDLCVNVHLSVQGASGGGGVDAILGAVKFVELR
ncbi:MAG TPA: hypothetical protein VLT61_13870 [Anaeromyxobacteraceae bacterium]|nr:hypothetical protein [Anaeromyxobacteraceae bacterium]